MSKIRGNSISFSLVFPDDAGDAVTLESAEVLVAYPIDGRVEDETITLTLSSSRWVGSWDSTISDAGYVHWTATGTDADENNYVRDGRVKLTANRANEEVYG